MQPPVGVQVRVNGDELFFERDRAYEVQEERLARAVLADDDAKRRAAVRDALDVLSNASSSCARPT
jgi:hypothetical protein